MENIELDEKKMDELWKNVNKSTPKLKIVMAGKTGVGKSSVINAITDYYLCPVAEDAKPCTKKNEEIIFATEMGDMIIVDVPGFGEANSPNIDNMDYMENINKIASDAHLLIMVLACNDKALELEEKFLNKWNAEKLLSNIPVLIVINKIDCAKPSKEPLPPKLNLDNPSSAKEAFIKSYLDYLSTIPVFSQYKYAKLIFPFCAGEFQSDPKYGVDNIKKAINDRLPEILSLILDRNAISLEEKAKAIIKYYAGAAAAICLQPIPLIDSFLIAPVQVGMIIHIGNIQGVKITKSIAAGLLSTIGLGFAGNTVFLNLSSIFPFVKQLLGPAIAFSFTYTIGLIFNELIKNKNLNPTKEEIKALAKKFKAETNKAKAQYKEEQSKD
ncbi:GTPase [uncultured Parabacteroides sp.]|uniref:GTPase n=1 Tax=uncultured Parabacteroides sp. TaxID=512312 RepID=UPI0026288D09|nr:GTPase [uncultured Parabacteroides sp.]